LEDEELGELVLLAKQSAQSLRQVEEDEDHAHDDLTKDRGSRKSQLKTACAVDAETKRNVHALARAATAAHLGPNAVSKEEKKIWSALESGVESSSNVDTKKVLKSLRTRSMQRGFVRSKSSKKRAAMYAQRIKASRALLIFGALVKAHALGHDDEFGDAPSAGDLEESLMQAIVKLADEIAEAMCEDPEALLDQPEEASPEGGEEEKDEEDTLGDLEYETQNQIMEVLEMATLAEEDELTEEDLEKNADLRELLQRLGCDDSDDIKLEDLWKGIEAGVLKFGPQRARCLTADAMEPGQASKRKPLWTKTDEARAAAKSRAHQRKSVRFDAVLARPARHMATEHDADALAAAIRATPKSPGREAAKRLDSVDSAASRVDFGEDSF